MSSGQSLFINKSAKHQFIWIKQATYCTIDKRENIKLNANTFIVLKPNTSFYAKNILYNSLKAIAFEDTVHDVIDSHINLNKFKDIKKLFISEANNLQTKIIDISFNTSFKLYKNINNDITVALIKKEINTILLNLLNTNKKKEYELPLKFYKLIYKNYKYNHLVKTYGKILEVKPKELLKTLKSLDYITPGKAIKCLILLEAKRLLVYSNKSIKDICFELGFSDPAYFSKFFKKYTGKTALNYKNELTHNMNSFNN